MLLGYISQAIDQYSSLITKCIKTKHLKLGMALHSHLIKTCLSFEPFLANRLIDMYSKSNSIQNAQKTFDDLPTKNIHSWNILINLHSNSSSFDKVRNLFDEMPERNLVSYNSLLSGLTRRGFYGESINVFQKMQKVYDCLFLDEYTLVSIVRSCACLGALTLLHQVHGAAIVLGLELNLIVYNALVDAYGKCGEPDTSYSIFSQMSERDVVSWTSMIVAYSRGSRLNDACQLFSEMPIKNVVSWTALITGFVQNGYSYEALDLFNQMWEEKITPSAFTFVNALSACADLALIGRGKQIHMLIIRTSSRYDLFNVYILNALIDMYSKCGDMKSAKTLFDMIHDKDVVSWNSLITGYAQNGLGNESLLLFRKMIEGEIRPNKVTFLGLLSACSHTGLVSEGLEILELMEKDFDIKPSSDHYAVLIDLYGRRNKLDKAMEIIKRAPNGADHVAMWGALLGACRVHGNLEFSREAAEALFELEPENAGRYVMLSNIYAAASRWSDARRVRKLMEERGFEKEAGYSLIEVRNERHKFVARDKFLDHRDEVYDMIVILVDQMKDAVYLPFKDEDDSVT